MVLTLFATAVVAAEVASKVMLFPSSADTQTIHVIEWDSHTLPKPIVRSEQLPLTEGDLLKLSRARFGTAELVQMLEERRCDCDASAEGLIRLKKGGVSKNVLSAVSLHALPPNRAVTIDLMLDFEGEGQQAREGFFYFFIDDGDITRVFAAPVGELLSRKFAHEEMVDSSDVLLPKTVRRIRLADDVPLKNYGSHTLLVASSANPAVIHPSQLRPQERAKGQSYTFQYPRSSLGRVCRLTAGFKRDAVLEDKWHFQGSQFECEWN